MWLFMKLNISWIKISIKFVRRLKCIHKKNIWESKESLIWSWILIWICNCCATLALISLCMLFTLQARTCTAKNNLFCHKWYFNMSIALHNITRKDAHKCNPGREPLWQNLANYFEEVVLFSSNISQALNAFIIKCN